MTAAKKVYTEQQMKDIAVRAFQTGRRVERAGGQSSHDRAYAKGFVHGAEVAQDPTRYRVELEALNAAAMAMDSKETLQARPRLTLLQGGAG